MGRLEDQSLLVHGDNDRTCEAQNGSASTLIEFECECGDVSRWETLSLSATDYAAFPSGEQRRPASRAEHDYARRSGSTRRAGDGAETIRRGI
jgi:hypothetical protein